MWIKTARCAASAHARAAFEAALSSSRPDAFFRHGFIPCTIGSGGDSQPFVQGMMRASGAGLSSL